MAKIEFKSLTLLDVSFGQVNMETFVGKRDLLLKKLRESSSYEGLLEYIQDELNQKEPKSLEEFEKLLSDPNGTFYIKIQEQTYYN